MLFYNYGYAFSKFFKVNSNNFFYDRVKNSLSFRYLWSHVIGCGSCGYYVNIYPVCNGSYVFVSDYYGIIKKLNFYTGECIWTKNLDCIISNNLFKKHVFKFLLGGFSCDENYLYIGSELGKVYALDMKTGAVLWISEVLGSVISQPVISRGLVLVYTSNGILQALDKRNGIIKWSANFDIPSFSFRVTLFPAVVSDIVIIGDSNGVVSACHIDTGHIIWKTKISSPKGDGVSDVDKLSDIVAPIIIDNVVYAISYNGNIAALNAFSGALIWSKNIGSLINFIVEDNFIYLVDQVGHVIALDKDNGNIIWNKSNLMYNNLISVVSYKSYILLGDSKGYLYFLSKEDGFFLGKKKMSVNCFNQPIIIFDKIIIYEKNGKLSVWDLVIDY